MGFEPGAVKHEPQALARQLAAVAVRVDQFTKRGAALDLELRKTEKSTFRLNST